MLSSSPDAAGSADRTRFDFTGVVEVTAGVGGCTTGAREMYRGTDPRAVSTRTRDCGCRGGQSAEDILMTGWCCCRMVGTSGSVSDDVTALGSDDSEEDVEEDSGEDGGVML